MFNNYKENNYRIDIYKNTTDDWYPSYKLTKENMLVKVSFINVVNDYESFCRVCAWGDDDCGLEMDFEPEYIDESFSMFLQVISLQDVTQEKLREF